LGSEDLPSVKTGGIISSSLRPFHSFLAFFLKALGRPIEDSDRHKYQLRTYGGRPDMTLIPE
jgi:hypothetical protein